MVITADIVDYMGKFEGGIIVLLSVMCNGTPYEGTIYYSDKDLVLTVDPLVETFLGEPIEKWEGYRSLLESIFSRLVPCSEIIGRLDDVDFSEFVSQQETIFLEDEINPDIIGLTQSNLS